MEGIKLDAGDIGYKVTAVTHIPVEKAAFDIQAAHAFALAYTAQGTYLLFCRASAMR